MSETGRGRREDHRQEGGGEVTASPADGLAAQDGAVPLPRAPPRSPQGGSRRAGWVSLDRLSRRLFPALEKAATLSPGDFPAGVTAPGGDIASVPLRPTLVGFTPRGSAASLLLATGGRRGPRARAARPAPDRLRARRPRRRLRPRPPSSAGRSRTAPSAAAWTWRRSPWTGWRAGSTRSATPRRGWCCCSARSQGADALGAVGVSSLAELKGRRLAVATASPGQYFALWLLMRAGLGPAGRALGGPAVVARRGAGAARGAGGRHRRAARATSTPRRPTAAAGCWPPPPTRRTSWPPCWWCGASSPRATRTGCAASSGRLLDAAAATVRDPTPAARLLGEVAPSLGDPREAMLRRAPGHPAREPRLLRHRRAGSGHLRRTLPERGRSRGAAAEGRPRRPRRRTPAT